MEIYEQRVAAIQGEGAVSVAEVSQPQRFTQPTRGFQNMLAAV